MGNPHPTLSKPLKIGRKHTGALGLRARGRKASKASKDNKRKLQMRRAFKDEVGKYFRGERETYPTNPFEKYMKFWVVS